MVHDIFFVLYQISPYLNQKGKFKVSRWRLFTKLFTVLAPFENLLWQNAQNYLVTLTINISLQIRRILTTLPKRQVRQVKTFFCLLVAARTIHFYYETAKSKKCVKSCPKPFSKFLGNSKTFAAFYQLWKGFNIYLRTGWFHYSI